MKSRAAHYQKGLWAEARAEMLLRLKGYKILARRYKTPVGEIDIIASRGRMIIAVEVKSRADSEDALYAVTPKNRIRVERALAHFLMTHPQYADFALRFDVVAAHGGFSLKHLDNAWLPGA